MDAQVLTVQIRRNQFLKQGLMTTGFNDFYEVNSYLIGLHSTDYWSPYLSVFARIGDYDTEEVFESVNSGRGLVRVPAFRNTQHVVLLKDFPLIVNALGPHLERSMTAAPVLRNLTDVELGRLTDEVSGILEQGPMFMRELKKHAPHLAKKMRLLLLVLMARGEVVRALGSHARSNRLKYALTKKLLSSLVIPEMTESDARRELVYRYIDTFGPVTVTDLSWWLPSTKTEAKEIVDSFQKKTVSIELDGKEHFLTKDDYEQAASIGGDEELGVWLLPYEDPFPKAYKIRKWYLPSDMKDVVFPRNAKYFSPPDMTPPPSGSKKGMSQAGEIRPSIWNDGLIIGRWEIIDTDGTLDVQTGFIHKIPEDVHDRVEEKRIGLAKFIRERLVPISS